MIRIFSEEQEGRGYRNREDKLKNNRKIMFLSVLESPPPHIMLLLGPKFH